MPTSQPSSLRLSGAPVRETVRISVENELLGRATGSLRPFLLRDGPHLPRTLRGKSWDRLEALGETLFDVSLKPRLRPEGVERVRSAVADGKSVILESRGLDHVVRPLARYLQVQRYVARRLEYRDGTATGRAFTEPKEQSVNPETPAHAVFGEPGTGFVQPDNLSVRRSLRGRHLLLVGGSGFIGKVWLASLLGDLPELDRVTILLRRKGEDTAEVRLAEMLNGSPVFEALRSPGMASLRESLGDRVRGVTGDVTAKNLGMDDQTARELSDSVDVVVSCAGLTEFNPDLRDALAVNVEGMIHLLDFVRGSRNAGLLHVSTCFVAGAREGHVTEELTPWETPLGQPFDPEEERKRLHATIQDLSDRASQGTGRRRPIRRAAIEAGLSRAQELGWPNIYTFTKGLGEAMIATHGKDLPVAVVRPSIVETSTHFPWAGWNEGINTSAPLSYLLSTPFRQLPVNKRKCLDVIPVDAVCRGMTLITAALVDRTHPEVTQLATSATNPLNLRRVVELTALAHRKHYRQIPKFKHWMLERLEAIPVSKERYQRLSVPLQIKVVRWVNRLFARTFNGKRPLARAEKTLRRVQDLIDLYEPFLLDNEPIFDAVHAELLTESLPESEREEFGVNVRNLDWYDYWVNIHIPALREWSYPLIEGRQPPATRSTPAAPTPAVQNHPLETTTTGERVEAKWPPS